MVDGFAFSEVVRKLANLIRIGKIVEIDGSNVKVKIGKVITGWLPIVSTAGETVLWNPISKDEQVVVFAPYGEFAQGFVLRSIHYDNYKKPENLQEIGIRTPNFIKISSKNGLNGEFDRDFSINVGTATINLTKNSITIKNGNSSISVSENGISINGNSISLSGGGASINLAGSVSINGNNITTNPLLCKCSGGL